RSAWPHWRAAAQPRHTGCHRLLVDAALSQGIPFGPPGDRDAAHYLVAGPEPHHPDQAPPGKGPRLRHDLEQGEGRGSAQDHHPGPSGKACRGSRQPAHRDRKSTRLNSSHVKISYAVFCLKKKTKKKTL